jgi:hypothetical protein
MGMQTKKEVSMANPNIGFGVIGVILGFHDLDYALRCGFNDKALTAISVMITSLRGLRRTITADVNAVAWIKGAKGGKNDETESH